MTCSICSAIPASVTVNTGRDEYFGPPVTSLTSLFDSRDDDLRQCPECGALYFWHEYVAFTGSGNNDDETMTRLPDELQAVIRAFMQRSEDTTSQLVELAANLFELGHAQRDLVIAYLARHRDLGDVLVPYYVAEAVRRNDGELVKELTARAAHNPAYARRVLAAVQQAPSPLFASLVRTCEQALCSTCGAVSWQTFRLEPMPPWTAGFKPLTDASDLDVWECRECGDLFLWNARDTPPWSTGERQLRRFYDFHAKDFRAVLERRPSTSSFEGIDGLLASHGNPLIVEVLATYAIERDRPLVRLLAPPMVLALAKNQKPWLADLLARLIAGHPADAALVLATIEKLPEEYRSGWHKPKVDELAAKCRAEAS